MANESIRLISEQTLPAWMTANGYVAPPFTESQTTDLVAHLATLTSTLGTATTNITSLQGSVATLQANAAIVVVQGADHPVTNNTLVSSAYLTVPLLANTSYQFEINAPFNVAGVVSGYKFQMLGPASPTFASVTQQATGGGALGVLALNIVALGVSLAAGLLSSGDNVFVARGTIVNGANAGNLTLQFAQNTTNASAITLKRGGYMIVRKI